MKHLEPEVEVVYPVGHVLVEVDKHPAGLEARHVRGAHVKNEKNPQERVHLELPETIFLML